MIKINRRMKLAIVLVGALLAMSLGYLFLWLKFVYPLKVFREQEINSIQYFDALNDSVFNELPDLPNEVKLVSKGTAGILSPTNMHGRRMSLEYSVNFSSSLTPDDILVHYKNALLSNGWEERPPRFGDESALYIQGTACFEIGILFLAGEYFIDIWHDFLAQEFSPELPSTDLFHSYDYGETDILTCPP